MKINNLQATNANMAAEAHEKEVTKLFAALDKLEERLSNCGFMRVQRSYIVNLNMINEFVPWFNNTYGMKLMGFNSKVIPISRNKVAQLKSIFEF